MIKLAGGMLLVFLVMVPFMVAMGASQANAGSGGGGGGIPSGQVRPGNPFGAQCNVQMAQPYGDTPYEHPHHGIDLNCPFGTPIVSLTAGRVYASVDGCPPYGAWLDRCGGGYGNHVVVEYRGRLAGDVADHDLFVLYCHMKGTPAVKVGQDVTPGTQLGEEGSSGWSTGPHLHLEVDRDALNTYQSINPGFLLAQGLYS